MDTVVSTVAPILLVAAAAGVYLYLKKPATKTSKKTTSPQNDESGYDLDDFPVKPKKVKKQPEPKPEKPKKVEQKKKVLVPPQPKPVEVAQVDPVVAKKADKKAAPAVEKKVEEKPAPAPKKTKEQLELEALRQRIAQLESSKAPEQKAGKKGAAAAVVSAAKPAAPTTSKKAEYNPAPQLSEEQRKEQEKALKEYERENTWREVARDNDKKKKSKVDEHQFIDLSVLTESETITVTLGNRRVIAGDNGETLKQICAQSGCIINLQQRPDKSILASSPNNGAGLPMKIELEGTVPQLQIARKIINDLVTKGYSSHLSPNMSEAKLKVDPSDIGQIVGPAAANLKKITEACQVKIALPPKDSPANEAIIHIVGDADGVAKAKEAIKSLVKDGYSTLTHPDWTKVVVPFPATYRRFMFIPNNGTTIIRAIEKAHGSNLNFPQNQNDEIAIVGPSSNVYAAAADVNAVAKKLAQPVQDVFLVGFEHNDFKANLVW